MNRSRDERRAIVQHFAKVNPPGSTTAGYDGYNPLMGYVVRDCLHPIEAVEGWEIPGLFVPYDLFRESARAYVTVFYVMGDENVLAAVFPVPVHPAPMRVPSNFVVLKKGVFAGRDGCWVAIDNWTVVGNLSNYMMKSGDRKVAHLAKKGRK